jgi:hypothetical protein
MYEDRPQSAVKQKKEKQTGLGFHRVQFIGGLTDRTMVLSSIKTS